MMTAKDRYADYLRSDHWINLRNTVRRRTDLKCEACSAEGADHGHEVHHLHYGKTGDWLDIEPADLIGLCQLCHAKAHEPANYAHVNRLPVSTDLRRRALIAILTLPFRQPTSPQKALPCLRKLAKRLGISERIATRMGLQRVMRLAGACNEGKWAAIAHKRGKKAKRRIAFG